MNSKKLIIINILLSIMLSQLNAEMWKLTKNTHGLILKSSSSNIYIGKTCDAISTIYGKGKWIKNKGKIFIEFPEESYLFNLASLFPNKKCEKGNITNPEFNYKKTEAAIPTNKCAIIVASRKTKKEVTNYIDENINNTKYLNVYKSNNGWYAISIGFIKKSQSKKILDDFKKKNIIPFDSLCSEGARYISELSPNMYTQNIKKHTYTQSIKNYSIKKQNKDRTIVCLAKTWGPDVCSYQFNKFAKEKMNSRVNDTINSPICTSLIAEIMNEPATKSDLKMAIITGMLDEIGSKGIDSESVFYNVIGGVAHVASFGTKITIYNECISKR